MKQNLCIININKMGNMKHASISNCTQNFEQSFTKQVNLTLPFKSDLAGMETDEEFISNQSFQSTLRQGSSQEIFQESYQVLNKKIMILRDKMFLSTQQKRLKWALENTLEITIQLKNQIFMINRQKNNQKIAQIVDQIVQNGSSQDIQAFYYHLKEIYRLSQQSKPDFSEILNKIGGKFLKLTKYSLCQQALQLALTIQEQKDGNSDDYANIINNFGVLMNKLGKKYSAIQCYNKSLKIYEQNKGKWTLQYASIIYNIGLIMKEMNQKQKGLQKLKQSLSIYQKIEGKMSIECVNSCHIIGTILCELGRQKEGVLYLRRCYMILSKYKETNSNRYKINKSYLETILKKQNK